MPITQNDINLSITVDVDTKKFTFVDNTDLAGLGIATSAVTGVFTSITATGSTTDYTNTNHAAPDIDHDVSTTNAVLDIPVDSEGDIILGDWTITYELEDTTATAYQVSRTYTVSYCYVPPVIDLDVEASCFSNPPFLKSTDDTNYIVETVSPTIVRAHEIHYPPTTGAAMQTGTDKVLSTGTFYSNPKTHTAKLTSTLTYAFTGFTVLDTISGIQEYEVLCDSTLCDLYCCFDAAKDRLEAAAGNPTLYSKLLEEWTLAENYRNRIADARSCDREADISDLVAKIKKVLCCTDDCGCSDGDEPKLVTGLGSSLLLYQYTAFADDGIGTGFVLESSPTKTHIAVIQSATEIGSPAVGDFVGKWLALSGTADTNSNAGAGAQLVQTKVGNDTPIRTLTSTDTSVTIAQNADTVDFSVPASGETNTASALGGDADVFKQKTGVDLEFRGISSADGTVTITENANDIDLSVNDVVIPVSNQSELTAAFTTLSSTGGIVFMTDNITLSSGITLDFNNNIQLWGNGNAIFFGSTEGGSHYQITFNGSRINCRNVRWSKNASPSTITNSYSGMVLEDATMAYVLFDGCAWQDLMGAYSGGDGMLNITEIATSGFTLEMRNCRCATFGNSPDRVYDGFFIDWEADEVDAARFVFNNWYVQAGPDDGGAGKYQDFLDGAFAYIEDNSAGGITVNDYVEFVTDGSMTHKAASSTADFATMREIYPVHTPRWSTGTADPTSSATFGKPGDMYERTGGTPGGYIKITSYGSDTNWKQIWS